MTTVRVEDTCRVYGQPTRSREVLIPTGIVAWELGTTQRLLTATNSGWKAIEVMIKRTGRNDQDILSLIVRRSDSDQEELYHEDPTSGVLVAGRPQRRPNTVVEAPACGREFISFPLEDQNGTCTEEATVVAKKLWIDQEGVQRALAYHPRYDNDMTFVQDPHTGKWTPTARFALPANTPAAR
jgi:hypothetical protein